MKCARLHLLERSKPPTKPVKTVKIEKPRRYCQKRLVNPEHEEDPRWMDVLKRYHCNEEEIMNHVSCHHALESMHTQQDDTQDDLFLTVQTLKFQGKEEQRRRPRTSFKYKNPTNNEKHRMFIKQVISDQELNDAEKSSQLTCYYFDDYIKYLFDNDKSRPASGTSSMFLQGLSNKMIDDKELQISAPKNGEITKRIKKIESKVKHTNKKGNKIPDDIKDESESDIEDAKISYNKSGKRKSLTISRVQSPETVQVIRVDVVCNNTNLGALSGSVEDKKEIDIPSKEPEKIKESFSIKNNPYATKYQLTKTIKTLDEHLSGGAKVTLLCKTFKLSVRGKIFDKYKSHDRKYMKSSHINKNQKVEEITYR